MAKKTGGVYDPNQFPIFFPVVIRKHDLDLFIGEDHSTFDHCLVAVSCWSTLQSDVEQYIARGGKVLIDSGVFSLASEHARKHNMKFQDALILPLEDLDGYADLWSSYIEIVSRWRDQAWGYIEIDQGGQANKCRTRKKLEDMGLYPIPVFHPGIDDWNYLDELMISYDRIAVGNLAGSNPSLRRWFLWELFVRHQAHPDVWVHLLGYTMDDLLLGYGFQSSDSSTWYSLVRWGQARSWVTLRPFGRFQHEFRPVIGAKDADRAARAIQVGIFDNRVLELTAQHYRRVFEYVDA